MWAHRAATPALQAFFDGLSDEQKASIKAVSIDMSAGYEKAIRDAVPHAQVCFDPFHVVQLGGKAADQVRRDEYNQHGRSGTEAGKWIKGTRYSLLKDTAKQTAEQLLKLAEVVATNKRMYRAFLLYGELRYIYRLPGGGQRAPGRVARVGLPIAPEAVRQARSHDPQTQSRRTRRDRARAEQRTPRSPKQQGEIDLTPRIRLPLRQRAHRDDLPLLWRHPDRPPSPMTHPQTERRAIMSSQ